MKNVFLLMLACLAFVACRTVDVIDDDGDGTTATSATSSSGMNQPTLLVESETVAAKQLMLDDKMVTVACFSLQAEGGDIPIKSLRFTRAGTGSASDIEAVRIYGDAMPLSISPVKTIDPMDGSVTFDILLDIDGEETQVLPNGAFTVACLEADFNAPAPGGQHSFGIASSGDVVIENGIVVGDFPLSGPSFLIGSAPSLGKVTTTPGDPVDSFYAACATDPPESVPFFNFTFEVSALEDLEINRLQFILESTDGGYVKGSKGTPYFTSIAVRKTPSGVTAMGPTELAVPIGSVKAEIGLNDSFDVLLGTTTQYQVVGRLSACVEDAPGELFGHHYRIVKRYFILGDVESLALGEFLPESHMPPQSDIVGNEFEVVAP